MQSPFLRAAERRRRRLLRSPRGERHAAGAHQDCLEGRRAAAGGLCGVRQCAVSARLRAGGRTGAAPQRAAGGTLLLAGPSDPGLQEEWPVCVMGAE